MTKIVHIIESLSLGGAARSLMATSRYSRLQDADFEHSVVSLKPAEDDAIPLAEEADIKLVDHPEENALFNEIEQADIVQLHYWNNPSAIQFLHKKLPKCRLAIFYHVAGDRLPQIIVPEIARMADWNLPCSPYTEHSIRRLEENTTGIFHDRTTMVYGAADLARIEGLKFQKHDGFNVGYIGTVDYVKLHSRFLPMSAAVRIPEVKFIVCGGWSQEQLRKDAQKMGISNRFDFRGYVNDLRPVLETMDVYGYPLREDTYAASELNLQEVMYAGIPPVVFPHGGIRYLVEHEKTGLVVRSEWEYSEAIEYLYHHPEVRKKLGMQARKYAKKEFGAENAARRINEVYREMMKRPSNAHQWGVDTGNSLLNDSIDFANLISTDTDKPMSRLFLESVGEFGDFYRRSVAPYQSLQEYLSADLEASHVSSLVYSTGIQWYLRQESGDAKLNFWTGLYFLGKKDKPMAITHLAKAWSNGFGHWRVLWYLRDLLSVLGKKQEAQQVSDLLDQTHRTWKQELASCGITPQDLPVADPAQAVSHNSVRPEENPGTTREITLAEQRGALDQLVHSEICLEKMAGSREESDEIWGRLKTLAKCYPRHLTLSVEIAQHHDKEKDIPAAIHWYHRTLQNASEKEYSLIFKIVERLAGLGRITEAVGFIRDHEEHLSQKPGFTQLLDSLTQYAGQMENL